MRISDWSSDVCSSDLLAESFDKVDGVVFDDGVGEQPAAHLVYLVARLLWVRIVQANLDVFTLAHLVDALKAERFPGMADGLALRAEHAVLQSDVDPRLQHLDTISIVGLPCIVSSLVI